MLACSRFQPMTKRYIMQQKVCQKVCLSELEFVEFLELMEWGGASGTLAGVKTKRDAWTSGKCLNLRLNEIS